jgi:hypothetical protein
MLCMRLIIGTVVGCWSSMACSEDDGAWAERYDGKLNLKYTTNEREGAGTLSVVIDTSLETRAQHISYMTDAPEYGEVSVDIVKLRGDRNVARVCFFDYFVYMDAFVSRSATPDVECRQELWQVEASGAQHTVLAFRCRLGGDRENGTLAWYSISGDEFVCVLVGYQLKHALPDSFLREFLERVPSGMKIRKVTVNAWRKEAFNHWADRLASARHGDRTYSQAAVYFLKYERPAFGLLRGSRNPLTEEDRQVRLDEAVARIRAEASKIRE